MDYDVLLEHAGFDGLEYLDTSGSTYIITKAIVTSRIVADAMRADKLAFNALRSITFGNKMFGIRK